MKIPQQVGGLIKVSCHLSEREERPVKIPWQVGGLIKVSSHLRGKRGQ